MEREQLARRDYLGFRREGWDHKEAMDRVKSKWYGGDED